MYRRHDFLLYDGCDVLMYNSVMYDQGGRCPFEKLRSKNVFARRTTYKPPFGRQNSGARVSGFPYLVNFVVQFECCLCSIWQVTCLHNPAFSLFDRTYQPSWHLHISPPSSQLPQYFISTIWCLCIVISCPTSEFAPLALVDTFNVFSRVFNHFQVACTLVFHLACKPGLCANR